MNTFAMIACTAGAAALLTSCVFVTSNGNGKTVRCKGPVQTKSLDLKDFDRITLNGSSDIQISQRETFSVQVEANEEVFDLIDFHVENGTLVLASKDHVNIRAEKFEVTVCLPVLKDFTLNGAADLDFKGGYYSSENLALNVNGAGDLELNDIQVPELRLSVNGAGDVELNDIDVQALSISVNGAGDVDVSGKADKASFSVSGAGDIDARNLACENIETHKSGVASIRTAK